MEKRICSKCGIEKDINEYGNHKANKDGIHKWCKSCCSDYQKQYRYKNSDLIKENQKQYIKDNKEKLSQRRKMRDKEIKEYHIEWRKMNKEKIKQYNKWYKEKNKEVTTEQIKQWRKNNKFEMIEYGKKYAKEHRDIFCMNTRKRSSIKKQLPSTLTLDQWNQCKEYFNNRCAYCGEEKPLAQEHFIPLSKNGGYTKDNIIPSCKSCNSSKCNRIFEEWYPKQSYYSKERELKILEYLCQVKLKST